MAQPIRIIPYPQKITLSKDTFEFTERTKIVSSVNSRSTAIYLRKYMNSSLNCQVEILSDSSALRTGYIHFIQEDKLEAEAYELHVLKNKIRIVAADASGWFYGVQSLLQLFPENIISTENGTLNFKIPGLTIQDAPRFSWRAFMLDESRHFKGAEQVKLLLDEMAFLKMNVFHWHLVDDQGWRIEIKKYPLLTEIGSVRKSTQVGALKWKSPIQSGEVHSGYYTQDEIRDIIDYAKERCITIIPEIEMPGHSSAAISSYPWLGTNKEPIEVPVKFGVGKDVYDVTDPKVNQFLTDVLDEVMELFDSKVIHIGGDEVRYDHWKSSETVNEYMRENKLNTPADLQVHFTNKISNYLDGKGRRMMGWNEILGHNVHKYQTAEDAISNQQLASNSIVHFWEGNAELIKQAATNGYDVVNSWNKFTYLNRDYDLLPLSLAYSFDPAPVDLDSTYKDKIIGIGCQMWSEWIPTLGEMHYQVFPRIAAYAEVGWTIKQNKNFEEFKSGLLMLQKRWKDKGIYYAPSSLVEKK